VPDGASSESPGVGVSRATALDHLPTTTLTRPAGRSARLELAPTT
jgi:hypothetical protein